ncbi:MAG: hypothetical protein GY941_16590 [Planctomycetes bacterium]|nr:hypothetical protein [Planctomycetota bacterium]
MPGGRPPLYTSHEEIEVIIQEYFESVTSTHPETGVKIFRPTLSGLAIALDMDRKSLYNYGKKEEFFPTIKKARGKVEEALESNLYNNGVAGTIFNLKNNFDWVDKTERENSGTTNVLIGHKDASVL